MQSTSAAANAAPSTLAAFPLTRNAALDRLQVFVPDAGSAYARLRNLDKGAGGHVHVSRLSPALRRRLITEDEVVEAVLARHGLVPAEKFISEVFWRTYWKGWLEHRPSLWTGYLDALLVARRQVDAEPALARRLENALAARTGIDCFDAWMTELDMTGYLHNWSRMQFASIWIFTLGLPWEIGADVMFGRLLDADPASNTLSWRWVAGLHTAGKAYLADADRIQAMTGGRFAPKNLARRAVIPLDSLTVPKPAAPRPARPADLVAPSLLLLTVEDLSVEQLAGSSAVTAIAVMPGETEADRIALADGLERAQARWPDAAVLGPLTRNSLASARQAGCRQIVTGFHPVGPTADRLAVLRKAAAEEGLFVAELLRDWDRRAWPHCQKGFFGLKDKIPALIKTRMVPR